MRAGVHVDPVRAGFGLSLGECSDQVCIAFGNRLGGHYAATGNAEHHAFAKFCVSDDRQHFQMMGEQFCRRGSIRIHWGNHLNHK